jgi:hypothetical protein
MKNSFGIKIVMLTLLLNACAWVDHKHEAESVQLLTEDKTASCSKLGVATTKTLGKVWFYKRRAKTVQLELQDLARNEALAMRGNAIRPIGDVIDGRQSFLIYHCN